MKRGDDAALAPYLAFLDEAFDRRSWHGPNLRGALRGLTARQAAARSAPGRHNAWEIALHAAYWKYVVARRLSGARRGSFPLAGSNWWSRPVGPARDGDWRSDVALLVATHRRLRSVVAGLTAADLARVPEGGRVSVAQLLRGVAAHDLYHAGQIQLSKRLARIR